MPLFPDPDLEDFIRTAAKIPEKSEDAMWLQEQQAMQEQQQMAAFEPGSPEEEFGTNGQGEMEDEWWMS
jgi:hypothetical protein